MMTELWTASNGRGREEYNKAVAERIIEGQGWTWRKERGEN